jgi:hypothetical protein
MSNFEQSQVKIMNDCVNDTSDVILDANREQMLLGLDKNGKEILPEYKPYTRERKIEKGRDPDTVTLYDTGEWHRSLFMKNDGAKILIDSQHELTDELMTKYNKQDTVLGIPQPAKENINESIMDKFINIFRLMTKL